MVVVGMELVFVVSGCGRDGMSVCGSGWLLW